MGGAGLGWEPLLKMPVKMTDSWSSDGRVKCFGVQVLAIPNSTPKSKRLQRQCSLFLMKGLSFYQTFKAQEPLASPNYLLLSTNYVTNYRLNLN